MRARTTARAAPPAVQRRGAAWLAAVLPAVCVFAVSCSVPASAVLLASTSSADDTGLLDTLAVAYHAAQPPYRVRTIVVGTGEALALGARGDADVLLVHAVADELRFMAAGHGTRRATVFENDFVVVGPPADPAGVRGTADGAAALARIAAARATFISRGDDSGTHSAELALWRAAGLARPSAAEGYVEAGLGMAETLRMASERAAYTLTDRATWRVLTDGLRLDVLVESDSALRNPYSVIVAAAAPNRSGAEHLAAWLQGADAAAIIARFGADRYGAPLFRLRAPGAPAP